MIKLTAPDGKPVWIAPSAILKIRSPIISGDKFNAEVCLANGDELGVREYPEDVVKMLAERVA